jgi:hypothetical protein
MLIFSNIFGQRAFVRNVGWLLCITGLAKVVSFFGHSAVLQTREPISQIPFRELFLVAGVIELGVAAFCLMSKRLNHSTLVIAWLSTVFLAYRFSLAWIGWQLPCPCLGNFVDTLHISPLIADLAMKAMVTYMFAMSYIHLLCSKMFKRNEEISC